MVKSQHEDPLFFPGIERSTISEIGKFQEIKLQQQLEYLGANSKFYSDHFRKHRIDISRVRTLGDLENIPPTTKEDLQKLNLPEEKTCLSQISGIFTDNFRGIPFEVGYRTIEI